MYLGLWNEERKTIAVTDGTDFDAVCPYVPKRIYILYLGKLTVIFLRE